jgi:hypothetical protein
MMSRLDTWGGRRATVPNHEKRLLACRTLRAASAPTVTSVMASPIEKQRTSTKPRLNCLNWMHRSKTVIAAGHQGLGRLRRDEEAQVMKRRPAPPGGPLSHAHSHYCDMPTCVQTVSSGPVTPSVRYRSLHSHHHPMLDWFRQITAQVRLHRA